MGRSHVSFLLALLSAHWPALVAPAAPDAGRELPEFHKLDNGLRLWIVEDRSLPLVSVQLWYRAGSSDNPASRAGLTHVIRALLAQRDDAAARAAALGLRFESRTLFDACYFATCLPSEYLDIGLDLEAARMQPLRVTAEQFRAGLERATREARFDLTPGSAGAPDAPERDDDLDPQRRARRAALDQRILATLFPDHPYARPPEFVAAALADAPLDEVHDFARRWFVPGAATLFVIGDVSAPQVLDAVQRKFGDLKWSEPPRRAARDSPDAAFCRIDDGDSTYLAWRLGGVLSPETAGLEPALYRLSLANDAIRPFRALAPSDFRLCRMSEACVLTLRVSNVRAPAGADAAALARAEGPERVADASTMRRAIEDAIGTLPAEVDWNLARRRAALPHDAAASSFVERSWRAAWSEIVGWDILLADFERRQFARLPVSESALALVALADALQHELPAAAELQDAWRESQAPAPAAAQRPLTTAGLRPRLTHPGPRLTAIPLDGGRVATVCQLPGMQRCAAGLSIKRPAGSGRFDADRAPHAGGVAFADRYAAYHSIERLRDGLRTLDSSGLESAIELMIRERDDLDAESIAGATLVVAGAVEPEQVAGWAAAWLPKAGKPEHVAESQPAEIGARVAGVRAVVGPPGVRLHWVARADSARMFPLFAETARRLLAPPGASFPPLGAWTCEPDGGVHGPVEFSAFTESGQALPLARELVGDISRLLGGQTPEQDIAAAMEAARVALRVGLDRPEAIARALLGGVAAPWDPRYEFGPGEFRAWFVAAFRRGRPEIVCAGDAQLAREVSDLGAEAARAWDGLAPLRE